MSKPHILLAHRYWKDVVNPGDLVIDMTCGNGHDTSFLAGLQAKVFAFDIQASAVENTQKLVPSATIFHRSHDELDQVELPSPPKLIVYNLGYLPGGDKSIVTKRDSTVQSLKQAILLSQAISIMCYPGHEEGFEEEKEVLSFVKGCKDWTVIFHQWVNRERAPSLIWMIKN